MNVNSEGAVQEPVTIQTARQNGFETANVVIMSDHIARLRDEGKIKRRGFFFTYVPEGAAVIDLTARRLERIRQQYC
ncbi:MAG: hypothetical protein KJ667_03295 [Alphaproteobacteria bacterium]|nr:hypothetical protein [Alphaproteobacteria bacterium]